MRRLVTYEHAPLSIGGAGGLTAAEAVRLQRFDEALALSSGETCFDWSRRGLAVARGTVGVVQVPGLLVEILPKVDRLENERRAQANLLFMLEQAELLAPSKETLAHLGHERAPLLDSLALAFANGLLLELRRGVDRGYVTFEENARVVRGRLLVQEHVRHNSVLRHRLYVRFDELSNDTPLNRVLAAACSALARSVQRFSVRRALQLVRGHFEGASTLRESDLNATLTRQNRRFQLFFDFARMVLRGNSPNLRGGVSESFSLLFEMHRVFEAFVGRVIQRNSNELGLGDAHVELQSTGTYLARDAAGSRFFGLRPDVLVRSAFRDPMVVLDTKWKLAGSATGAVSQSDAYQLYAYAQRFESPVNVLLYPRIEAARNRLLRFEGVNHWLQIAFVDVSRDLRSRFDAVLGELRSAIELEDMS